LGFGLGGINNKAKQPEFVNIYLVPMNG